MDYRIDADRRGFHVWLSDAEFDKVQSDATSCAVPLDEYLEEIMLWGVAEAVKVGLQPREGEVLLAWRAIYVDGGLKINATRYIPGVFVFWSQWSDRHGLRGSSANCGRIRTLWLRMEVRISHFLLAGKFKPKRIER